MKRRWGTIPISLLLFCAFAFMLSDAWSVRRRGLKSFRRQPLGVMGTECELIVVVPQSRTEKAGGILRAAEAALRNTEAHMSVYLVASELSRLNAAPAGQIVKLSPEMLQLLRKCRKLAGQTRGAFDVTCRPLFDVWAQAGKEGRLPTDEEIRHAKSLSGWQHIELLETGARKRIDGASIDLGGIAKGYAIDLAVRAMGEAGADGGLVNVGGDVACFGRNTDAVRWTVGVRSPFDETMTATLAIADAAVCTSGNYRRFVEIGHKRYSHIVDPRSGRPAEMTPSVTVIGPVAAEVDAWATALSVLGVEGLRLIPDSSGIEAMIVIGTAESYEIHISEGFDKFFVERPKVKPKHCHTAINHASYAGSAELSRLLPRCAAMNRPMALP